MIFNVLLLVENNVGAALAIAGAIHHRENQIKFSPFFATSGNETVFLVWRKETILARDSPTFLKKFKHALQA